MDGFGMKVNFQIEIEENPLSVFLVFDRKTEMVLVPWQDAFRLTDVIQQACLDYAKEFMAKYPLLDPAVIVREQSQIRVNTHKNLVAICVDHTDRVGFTSLTAFSLAARAIRIKAQDAELVEEKGLHLVYGKDGLTIKEIHNVRSGIVQIVPGR